MMPLRRHRSPDDPSRQSGQAVIEFAMVAPVAFLLLFGLIGSCWLFFQDSSLHNGATAGARAASIETSLVTAGTGAYAGQFCESGLPTPIEQAVAQAAPGLGVSTTADPLCATAASAAAVTQLTQGSPGSVAITVTCAGGCATPTQVTVSLVFNAKGIVAPVNLNYTMKASSEVPVLAP